MVGTFLPAQGCDLGLALEVAVDDDFKVGFGDSSCYIVSDCFDNHHAVRTPGGNHREMLTFYSVVIMSNPERLRVDHGRILLAFYRIDESIPGIVESFMILESSHSSNRPLEAILKV